MADDESQELSDLRELVRLWPTFTALVEAEWGPAATLTKIDRALAGVDRGETAAVNDTVQQIQASRREVYRVLGLPAARIAQLAAPKKSRQPFEALRRIGR